MREAPALAGVTGKAPRPSPARRAKPPVPRRGGQGTLVGRALARPGVTIAGAVFAALMTGVVANALFLQKGHHPAPLFGAPHAPEPAKAPAPSPAPVPAAPPAAASAPAPVTPAAVPPAAPVQPATHAQAAGPAHAKAKPKPAAKPAHVDGIGQLLGRTAGQPKAAAGPKPGHKPPQPAATASKPHTTVAPVAAAPHT